MNLFILGSDKKLAADIVRWSFEINGVEEILLSRNSLEFIPKIGIMPMDMVFIQLDDPDILGIEIAECIRRVAEDTKVVFVSKDDSKAIHAFEHGAFNYLIAPIKEKDFYKVLKMAS